MLKDLVPMLELCEKIPTGKFGDSSLIWFFDGKYWWVNAREFDAIPEKEYPAPTLAEIMEALSDFEPVCVTLWRTGQAAITCQCLGDEMEKTHYNPAEAALKLWLEIYGEDVE